MKVLITGATGELGREILSAARQAKIGLRALTRHSAAPEITGGHEWIHADLASGEGLSNAVAGVDTIIHAATDPRNGEAVDVAGTRRLIAAAASAGVRHFIHVSIVGIDQIPLAYYRHKLAAEESVTTGPVPFSVLRATQFHAFVDRLISSAAKVPLLMPLPTRFQLQSVAASELACRLLRCVEDGPRGRLADFSGPEVMTLGQAVQTWQDIRGLRKRIVHLPLPGATSAAFRAGKNTTANGERGSITWRDWLIEHSATSSAPSNPDAQPAGRARI